MASVLPLSSKERASLFKFAANTPRILNRLLAGIASDKLKAIPEKGFSLHQHLWHLADLELEAFKQRINLLLLDDNPKLVNFDGDRVAAQRNYHTLSFIDGIKQFSNARLSNLWVLSGISHADWMRSGYQENVGDVRLVDVFRSMCEHDQAHLEEIRCMLGSSTVKQSNSTVAA